MSTIIPIEPTDVIANSRADINSNFSALNTDKAELASPTFTGTLTSPAIVLSSETASTIAGFDASKNIKSLALATYPSLTEIAYVKGVTSAIQTQLNAKEATITTLAVNKGGTGVQTLDDHFVLIGSGTSAVTPITPSDAGKVLTSNGVGADPSFQTVGLPVYATASDNVQYTSAGEVSAAPGAFAEKTFTMKIPGIVRVKYQYKQAGDTTGTSTHRATKEKEFLASGTTGAYLVRPFAAETKTTTYLDSTPVDVNVQAGDKITVGFTNDNRNTYIQNLTVCFDVASIGTTYIS